MANEYVPYFHSITRPSGDGGHDSCINNFFVKTSSIEFKPYKLEDLLTDHYPLLMTFEKAEYNVTNTKEYTTCINYTKLKKKCEYG